MEKIFKYELKFEDDQIVEIPNLIKVLSVIEQNNVLMLYVLVRDDFPDWEFLPINVFIRGTGHRMNEAEDACFLGTVPTASGLVWHVFYSV